METKHLDNLINDLETLESKNWLSELGQETLNEYRAIKQALSQHDVSGCVCDEEEKHGWTTVKCCNRCGLSIEDFWNKHIH